jgi:hypothetical protein
MQLIHTCMRATLIAIIITALEVTILWNQIGGVNSLSTAGQIIPLVIGISAVLRIFYLSQFAQEEDDPVAPSVGDVRDIPLGRPLPAR